MFPGGIMEMLEQAKTLQARFETVKEELRHEEVEASSGAGMVTATVNGLGMITKLKIDPAAISELGSEPSTLEDLVSSAVNEAIKKSRELVKGKASSFTGGLPIPNLW